jgi:hypothetical protein
MNQPLLFELSEDHAFTGRKTLRLKQNHIKFRGFNGDVSPVPARNSQIAEFKEVLDFLDVWHWKPKYDPEECGMSVLDGKSWSFTANLTDLKCKTGGFNAYPSLSNVDVASLNSQRYDFLVYAIQSVFDLERIDLRKAMDA